MCYQILIYLLHSCLLGFTQLKRGVCLDLLKTLIHIMSKPNFSCLSVPHRFIQAFIDRKHWTKHLLAQLACETDQNGHCSWSQASSRNSCIWICAGKETHDCILAIKRRLTRGFCRAPSFPANTDALFGAFRSPTILIFVHMTLSHCLVHRERTNQNKISTYTCVNSVECALKCYNLINFYLECKLPGFFRDKT